MPTILQHRRGTTACAASSTLCPAEIFVDCQRKEVYLHDGSTSGGILVGGSQDCSCNIVYGTGALANKNASALNNTAVGAYSLCSTTGGTSPIELTGSRNIAIGVNAGCNNIQGLQNITLGDIKGNGYSLYNTQLGKNNFGGTNAQTGRLDLCAGSLGCLPGQTWIDGCGCTVSASNRPLTFSCLNGAIDVCYHGLFFNNVPLCRVSGTNPSERPCVGTFITNAGIIAFMNPSNPGAGVGLDTVFQFDPACIGFSTNLCLRMSMESPSYTVVEGICNFPCASQAQASTVIGHNNGQYYCASLGNNIIGSNNLNVDVGTVGACVCHFSAQTIILGNDNLSAARDAGGFHKPIVIGNQSARTFNDSFAGANIFVGNSVGRGHLCGGHNIFIGDQTANLPGYLTGSHCAGLGCSTGCSINSIIMGAFASPRGGIDSTIIGTQAGSTCDHCFSNSTLIGYRAGDNLGAGCFSDRVVIGDQRINCFQMAVQSISSLSDCRDKKNITPISIDALSLVNNLNPVKFTWNTRDCAKIDIDDFGFIAQEVLSATDEIGVSNWLDLVGKDDPNRLDMKMTKLIPVLVKAIQQLSNKVEQLENK